MHTRTHSTGTSRKNSKKVICFRENYDQYERPDDVNALVRLFLGVEVREGDLLDYEVGQEGGAATRISPFARKIVGAKEEDPPTLDAPPPELEDLSDQDAERLYRFFMNTWGEILWTKYSTP